jgi:DNA-directed RNA polymerase specialized sigma24 family protein
MNRLDQEGESREPWILTEEAFNKLLAELDSDRDRAADKLILIRTKLEIFFARGQCLSPEDQIDETIKRVARKVSEGVNIHLGSGVESYFFGIAKHVLLEDRRKPERGNIYIEAMSPAQQQSFEKRYSVDPIEQGREQELDVELDRQIKCFRKCLRELKGEQRELAKQYNMGGKGEKAEIRKKLASTLGISTRALTLRWLRIEKKLDGCYKDCLEKQLTVAKQR